MLKTPLFSLTDAPWSPRHLLWHVLFGMCLVTDGLVAVLSLGMLTTNSVVWFMEAKSMNKLFAHGSLISIPEEMIQEPVDPDKIRSTIANALGIDPSEIVSLDKQQGVRGPVPKSQDWN